MDDCLDSGPQSKSIETDISCQSPFRVILCRFLPGRKPTVPARCIQAWNISFNGGWAICRSKMIPGRKMLSGNLSKPLERSGDERQRGTRQPVSWSHTGRQVRRCGLTGHAPTGPVAEWFPGKDVNWISDFNSGNCMEATGYRSQVKMSIGTLAIGTIWFSQSRSGARAWRRAQTGYATGDKLRHEKLFSVKGDPKQPEQTDLTKISPVSGHYRGKSHNLAHNYNGSENNSGWFVFLTIEEMLQLFQTHY